MAKKKLPPATDEGLFQGICQSPEDDLPRLVYADWLEEHHQLERAEFIRLQCRLAKIDVYDPERLYLQWREGQLLTATHEKAWGELPVKPVKQRAFHRGFVDEISLHAALFLERADELFARIPLWTLRPLRISPVWNRLLASLHLLRLRGLDVHDSDMSRKRCTELAASECVAGLHRLNLGANGQMGAAGFTAILGSRRLANLRRLDLNLNRVGNDAFAAFVGNDHFPQLRRLDLTSNEIGPEGVAHLARADWLTPLEQLDLSYNPLGDEGVRRLAESGILAGHKSLRLLSVDLTASGVRSLVNCPHLSELTELHLEGVRNAGGDLLTEVAQSTTLNKLRVLGLHGGSGVSAAGMEALVRSPLAARLRVLDLSVLTPGAFKTLFTAQSLSGLTWLDVYGSSGGVDLVELLRSATHLKNLHFLKVKANPLSDKELAAIVACAHFAGLAELSLADGPTTRRVWKRFAPPSVDAPLQLVSPFRTVRGTGRR